MIRRFHTWISFGAFLLVAAEDCEVFAGERLSAWQIAKKALWDRVRGASLEISMQEGALLQLSVEVESISGASQDCPLGMLALQLFLLDMLRALPKSSQQTEIASWFEKLINQAIFETKWSDIIQSGWPIFGLLARLSQLSPPFQLDTDVWQRIMPVKSSLRVDEIQIQLQDAFKVELKEAGDLSHHTLLKNFFSSGSTALWTDMSLQAQEHIFKEAALKDGQLHGIAHYFLSHLRREFAGFSGPVDPFLKHIFKELEPRSLTGLRCWDVGAAPVPRRPDKVADKQVEQDVWQICDTFGLATKAFEPSELGFQRLSESSSSLQSSSLQIHRLALSNITGQAHFNRGGQVTGSLGSRGCASFAFRCSYNLHRTCIGGYLGISSPRRLFQKFRYIAATIRLSRSVMLKILPI